MAESAAMNDYLTPQEAARYARVPVEVFEAQARRAGILPFTWMGVTLYRAADIREAMEDAWRKSTAAARLGTSTRARVDRAGTWAAARAAGRFSKVAVPSSVYLIRER